MSEPFVLSEFTAYRANVLAAEMSRVFVDTFLSKFNLSVPEWRVLARLSQQQSISVRDLDGPQMDRSTVTRAVQVLERSGFVRKAVDPADRRLLSLTLTPKGKKLIDKLLPLAIDFQKKLIEELGPQDAAALERIFSKLQRFLTKTAKFDEIRSSVRHVKH